MSLHGTIEVNGFTIGEWVATCGDRQADGFAEYTWQTRITPSPLRPADAHAAMLSRDSQTRSGTLIHEYRAGALALAAKVLAAATAERDHDWNEEPTP